MTTNTPNRDNQHGGMEAVGNVAQRMKSAIRTGRNWQRLSWGEREALDMICHKVGRVLSGADPHDQQHWEDVAGYAHAAMREQKHKAISVTLSVAAGAPRAAAGAGAESFAESLGEGVDLQMLAIPAGQFLMGSPPDELEREEREGPQHPVRVSEFWMAQTPITQAQWQAVMGSDPSRFNGSDSAQRPVESVSWHEAMEFCRRLSQRTGRRYTLPSEAQWEYACRAGTATPFSFGQTLTAELANYDASSTYADGPQGECRQQTTPVGMFPANAWGLHDMHGNVWEWCLDHWHPDYKGAPSDGRAWLSGDDQSARLLRGGSWNNHPRYCRSAYRSRYLPATRSYILGFRVCCLPQG